MEFASRAIELWLFEEATCAPPPNICKLEHALKRPRTVSYASQISSLTEVHQRNEGRRAVGVTLVNVSDECLRIRVRMSRVRVATFSWSLSRLKLARSPARAGIKGGVLRSGNFPPRRLVCGQFDLLIDSGGEFAKCHFDRIANKQETWTLG